MIAVEFTPEAAMDLEGIGDWIARDNPPRAATFVGELRLRCEGIARHPLSYPLIPRYERANIRRRNYRGYIIFYRIGTSIEIIRVMSDRRDYAAILFPD